MTKVKIGIVGAGRLGGFHANKAQAHPNAILAAVFDPLEANRNAIASKFNVRACSTPDELFDLVDAAVIAAPTSLHHRLAKQALSLGKHLLVEKPLCVAAGEAAELVELAREKKRVLKVGHVERYNPAWRAAFDDLKRAKRNGPLVIESTRTSGYTFRCVDVGAVLDLMIHDLELILALADSEPTRVTARATTDFGGHEDSCWATLTFPDRTVARLFASRTEQTARREMTVRAERFRARIDFAARTATFIEPDDAVTRGDYAPERVDYAKIVEQIPTFMADHYRTTIYENEPVDALSLEMDDFVSAIIDGNDSLADAERAAAAVRLAERILTAAGE